MTGDIPSLQSLGNELRSSEEWATWNEGIWIERYCEGALNALKELPSTNSFFENHAPATLPAFDDSDMLMLHENMWPEDQDENTKRNGPKERILLDQLDDTATYYIAEKAAASEFRYAIFFPGWRSPVNGALEDLPEDFDIDTLSEPENILIDEDSESETDESNSQSMCKRQLCCCIPCKLTMV